MFIKEMGILIFLKITKMCLLLACIQNPIIQPKKSKSDLDIELEDNTGDQKYIETLKDSIQLLNKQKFDFVFYIAGVDVHFNDRLGKLKLSDDGIKKREEIVIGNFFSKKIPICGVLGGGYNKNFDKLVELHSILHETCAKFI